MADTRIILMPSTCCGDTFKTVKNAFEKGDDLFLAGLEYFYVIDMDKKVIYGFKDGEVEVIRV